MASAVAVVVGVGPGLGASVAARFANEGFSVGLLARRQEHLDPVHQRIERSGARALSVICDATDPKGVENAFGKVKEDLGPVDVLVYNAGAFQMGGILDITLEQFDACWKANCAGGFYAARQVLPDMLKKKEGTILFTGATASLRGGAKFSCLAVGKFGLRALAQSMAREFGPQGIHVAHVVIDGQIDLPRVREMFPKREAHTFLAPDRIADVYWHLYSQDPTTWSFEVDLRPSVEKF